MKKAEPSRNHAVNGARGHRIMVPINKLQARVQAGYGGLLAEQLEANKLFRVEGKQPFEELPRQAQTLEDVTRGLGIEQGTDQQIHKLVGETNPEFTQRTQTQRIFLARRHLTETLRSFEFVDSDQRMEIVKRAMAYWRHNYQTDYFKPPTIRYVAYKSEPTLVIKAHARATLPQIPKARDFDGAEFKKAEQLGLAFGGSAPKSGPPSGYTAVTNSKKGGYRKRIGNRWDYWYPEGAAPKARAKKQRKPVVDVWGPLSREVVDQWRHNIKQIAKLQAEIKAEAAAIFEPQWKAWLEKPATEKQGLGFFEDGLVIPPDFTARYREAARLTKTMSRNLRQWAYEHVAAVPFGTDPKNMRDGGQRRVVAKAENASLAVSDGFPDHIEVSDKVRYSPGLAEILNDDYQGKNWKKSLAQARQLLNAVDTYVVDYEAEKHSRRAIGTFARKGVQFVVHNHGLGASLTSEMVIERVVLHAEHVQKKLEARGLGKAIEGVRLHVHNRSRKDIEGREHQDRADFVTAGYYHRNEDFVRLFASGHNENTLTHELGHRVYYQLMSEKGRRDWEVFYEDRRDKVTGAPDEFVTAYAETNASELFAEAFEDYVGKGPAGIPPRVRDQMERALRSTGMKLKKSDPAELRKAAEGAPKAGHKYIKRVPYMKDGKRRYRYYYRESAVARDAKEGEEVSLGKQLAKVLAVADDGTMTVQIGSKTQSVSPEGWGKLLTRHYGEGYLAWSGKRAQQTVNAVLRHVPREMLEDLKGSDEERLAQLKKRVPEVYSKLEKAFQRSGVSPFRAKAILGEVLDRRGWEPEARALVIGNVIEKKDLGYRQTIQAAESLAGGEMVKAGHVQTVLDIRKPKGDPKEAIDKVATEAEGELAALSAALALAKQGGTKEAAQALAAALSAPAMAALLEAAQAFPGLKHKSLSQIRDKVLEVPSVAPRKKPTRFGAESVVYVAGENGQPRALKTRYKLVEAGEAIASHKPGTFSKREDYPEGVQERAYHRDKDEQAKVLRNAHKLNPAFVINTNPDAVNGPPILDQNGVVLGGNSRTMSMQLAYEKHPEKAAEMKAYLAAHAHETGFNASDVKAMKNPILVREVVSEGVAEQKLLVRQMNESFTQGMDPRTMQVALGRKLDDGALKALGDAMQADESLGAFLDTPKAEPFINALMRVGVIDQRNSNQYMVKGTKRLNEDGKQLVERVLVGRTVGDADLLSNTGSKLISNIARAVPFLTQAKAYGKTYDLGDDLKVALEAFNDLNYRAQQGHRAALSADMSDTEFKGLFAQDEMFGEKNPIAANPRAMTMLEVLIRKNGPVKMARVFREYAAKAAQHPEDQESMFGDKPSPAALLKQAMSSETTEKSMEPMLIVKAGGPYIGKRGGKWADPRHTIPWKEPKPGSPKGAPQAEAKQKKKYPGHEPTTPEQSLAWLRETVEKVEANPEWGSSPRFSINFGGKRLNKFQARMLLDKIDAQAKPKKGWAGAAPSVQIAREYQGGAHPVSQAITLSQHLESGGTTFDQMHRWVTAAPGRVEAMRTAWEYLGYPTDDGTFDAIVAGSLDKLLGKSEPTLIVKARGSTFLTHVPVAPQAGSAPRFHTPPIPDFQDIYMQPESTEKQKVEMAQRETRQRAQAVRNRGKYGFHGTPLPLKPVLRWGDQDSAVTSDAIHDPDQPGKRSPRKSPKLTAERRGKAGKQTYEAAGPDLDGDDDDNEDDNDAKSKRKKKKKRAKLVARKR